MFKSIKNNKGFTLIELLAVIVILGILMIVAIPQVTKYIEQSKKDTFVDTAKAYINAARYAYLNDELTCTVGDSAIIPIYSLDVDNSGKSPFGGTLSGYIKITATSVPAGTSGEQKFTYTYTAYIQDSNKRWTIKGIDEPDLKRASVTKETGNLYGSYGKGSTTAVVCQ